MNEVVLHVATDVVVPPKANPQDLPTMVPLDNAPSNPARVFFANLPTVHAQPQGSPVVLYGAVPWNYEAAGPAILPSVAQHPGTGQWLLVLDSRATETLTVDLLIVKEWV